MNYKELNGMTIREGFTKYHSEHPEVYREFSDQVHNAISRGRTKVSAKLIINWIRWNKYLDSGKHFKINDAYQSYYARLFISYHPEHSEIFELRKLRNEEKGPYMMVEKNGQLRFF